jgi:hypothetical protein
MSKIRDQRSCWFQASVLALCLFNIFDLHFSVDFVLIQNQSHSSSLLHDILLHAATPENFNSPNIKFLLFFIIAFLIMCNTTTQPFNTLNAELNPICHLLALLAHHILHISRIRVKITSHCRHCVSGGTTQTRLLCQRWQWIKNCSSLLDSGGICLSIKNLRIVILFNHLMT